MGHNRAEETELENGRLVIYPANPESWRLADS